MKVKNLKLESKFEKAYQNYKSSAHKRGYSFNISTDQFFHIITSDCFYCGNSPREYADSTLRNGIDRIDNNKGYEKGNVISSCWDCNKMKGNLSYYEYIDKCVKVTDKITEFNNIRNKHGVDSSELLSYMFKFGKYLSPNEIFRCIMSGHLKKEDIKYDFKIALQEFDEEFNIVKRQLRKHNVKLKKLTRDIYNRSQLRFWHKANSPEEAMNAEREQVTELVTL